MDIISESPPFSSPAEVFTSSSSYSPPPPQMYNQNVTGTQVDSTTPAGILGHIHYILCDIWLKHGDKRVTQGQYWISSNGLFNSFWILLLYLSFVTYLGPRYMKNRAPLNITWYMIFHNFSMTAFNLYSLFKSMELLHWGAELLNFDAPDPEDRSERALNLIYYGQLYLFTKFADLMDSVVMVFRKKDEQLTFLHLYHHSVVPALGIVCFLLYPTATPVGAFIVLNSMIHTIMYSYYGLAALGPGVRKYLWWKKYITQIQIVQFMVYIVYCGAFFFLQRGYQTGFFVIGASQAPLFMFLFIRFYLRSYRAKLPAKAKLDKQE